MQRLTYHLTVQSDDVVIGTFAADGSRRQGNLDLSNLALLTRDYLPMLEAGQRQPRDRLARLGRHLYTLLFPAPLAGHFEERAWRAVEAAPTQARLALSLTFQEGVRPEVAALPWEFLYCPVGGTFLATDPRVAFSRRPAAWTPASFAPLGPEAALRVLLVALRPEGLNDVAPTRLKNGLNEMAEAQPRLLRPLLLENPSPAELEAELGDYRPHIVHLIVHGRFEERGTYFALVDGAGRAARWYRDRSLADLFQAHRPWLVLLQACEGGKVSDLHTLAQGAARLVQRAIPAVVAMQYPIQNLAAWTFAEALYERVVAGEDLDGAVQGARRALARWDQTLPDDHASRDFGGLRLWMRPAAHRPLVQDEGDALAMIPFKVRTPDGTTFAAEAPPATTMGQIIDNLLPQWRPEDTVRAPHRYGVRLAMTGRMMEPTCTLGEIVAHDTPDLELIHNVTEE